MKTHEEYLESCREMIAKHGLMIQHVFGDERAPSFSYTIGLSARCGFELILFAVRPEHAQYLLNSVAEYLKGNQLPLDTPLPSKHGANQGSLPILYKECNHPDLHSEYVCIARRLIGSDPRVVQMVIPDRAGVLPGEPGYDEAYMGERQPLLFVHH